MDDHGRWAFLTVGLVAAAVSFAAVPTSSPKLFKGILGACSAVYMLVVPYLVPHPYAELDVLVRLCAGYIAMKLLDLCVARIHHPPRMHTLDGRGPRTTPEWFHYAWRLAKETRYESFDISTVEPAQDRPSMPAYHVGTYTVVALLNYLLPHLVEVKILAVLLTIVTVFELGHAVLRPSSRTPLFDAPFLAPTLTSFWRRRWHAILLSPLNSLAFEPFSRAGGRAAGVLAAFALSGAWHAWGVLPIGGTALAWKVWLVFAMSGVGCLLEWAIWAKNKTITRRAFAWAWSLGWAGWALRGWDERGKYGL